MEANKRCVAAGMSGVTAALLLRCNAIPRRFRSHTDGRGGTTFVRHRVSDPNPRKSL
jgi:hypothetical protein